MDRPRVLIGFAEALAAIESAWCLADAGFEVVAFHRSGRRPPLASSPRVRVVPVPAPETSAGHTLDAVSALVSAERPVAVLPLDDLTLWLCDRLGPDAVVAGPRGGQARLALDKSEQLQLAEKAGFAVPPTALAGAEPPPGTGPWIVKSALATVLHDGRLRRPAGAIARTADEIPGIASRIAGPALVQPLLRGTGEGLFGFAWYGEPVALSAHRRIRMMNPRGSGASACRSIPVDARLTEPARQMLGAAGWHGIFMLEFLRDEAGQPWFMELNGRAWGSMALALRRGLPYPRWAVLAALDPAWQPPVRDDGEAAHVVCRHLGRELVHLLAVLRGAPAADAGRWPSRTQTLRAMLRLEPGTRWYHARRGELRVLARDTWATVAGQLTRTHE